MRNSIAAVLLLSAALSYPQEAPEVIRLPAAEITEQKDTTEYVTQETMERENSSDLWEALRNVPGVVRDGGGGMRNESNFTLRGLDEKLMPVFIDGVPMSSPYRGNTDYARFLTADLEDIEIQKGYSSMLLGPNTFGGAVIMRTAKPKKPFEALLKTGVEFDGAGKVGAGSSTFGLGMKQKLFYGKAMVQFRDVDHYRLSGKFTPYEGNPQGKGERLFSDSRDIKLTALAGWTPIDPVAVNVVYTLQDADKGVSPQETLGLPGTPTYDIWTLWRRQSVSADAGYTVERFYGKVLFAFDKFDNTLSHNYRAPSTYDDYGLGVHLEGGYSFNTWNTLKAAFIFKQDGHRNEKDLTEGGRGATLDIKENTYALGAEYTVNPWKPLTFTAGLGFDYFQPAAFWSINTIPESDGAAMFSAQAGVFYDITDNHEVHVTFAKKNHMPTMWVRYSSPESGPDIPPNPDLKPEEAYHYEVGYKGHLDFAVHQYFSPLIDITGAVYYSSLVNMLAEENRGGVILRVNADKTAYYGFETGLTARFNRYVGLGGALAINQYKIIYNAAGLRALGNYPAATGSVYIVGYPFVNFKPRPLSTMELLFGMEGAGERYSSNAVLPAYTLFHLRLRFEINEYLSVASGVENLFDADYVLNNSALPMPGRSFYCTVTARY
ncbi:TonB-dependent receptor [Spirochaetia bacterium]|nr:TonB-dependent receptor [Spirochaetia bacterium]